MLSLIICLISLCFQPDLEHVLYRGDDGNCAAQFWGIEEGHPVTR